MTKKGVDVEKAPTVIAMAEALSERNLGLMGAILALMIRVEAEPLYRQVLPTEELDGILFLRHLIFK